MDKLVTTVSVVTALSSALVAGVLFAFSNHLMKAFGKLPTAQGVTTFQTVNTAILNPVFLLLFVGTGVLSLVLGILSVVRWSEPGSAFLLIGSLLYLVGVIVETRIIHLPRNDALDKADPASERAATLWADMLSTWTTWNHVRVVAALAAATCFIVAAVRA
jgi:uncharacterized membrane protein